VFLDRQAPGLPAGHGTTPVRIKLPTWTWAPGGGGNGTYRYHLDSQDTAGATVLKDTTFTPATDLGEGLHTLFVQERDEAGNWSPFGRSGVRTDYTPPDKPAVTVTPQSPTRET